MLTAEDLTAIRQIVREEVSGKIDRPDKKTELPVREFTDEEVQALRAGFPGLTRPQDFVQFRTVQDCAEYINSALAKFGVELVTQLPDSVQSGSLPLYVRYPGPFPFGPADPLPGDVEGAGV